MNDHIKAILAKLNYVNISYFYPYYRHGKYDVAWCKELACRFEIWTECVVLGTKNPTESVKAFKTLSKNAGIEIKKDDIEIFKKWIIIRGWWARNVLRRELCRLVIRSGVYDNISLVLNGFYKNWFTPSTSEYFTNDKFKAFVENQKGFKVDKTIPHSGFFVWAAEEKIKL